MSGSVRTQLFINGAAADASDGRTYDIHNPARPDELVGCAAAATPDDVETAMQAAHAAFPAWAASSYAERGELLRKVAAAITQDMEEVERRAAIFTREHGKILFETRLETSRLGHRFEQVAHYGDRLAQDELLNAAPNDTIITRQPRGVAALVVPWNWPRQRNRQEHRPRHRETAQASRINRRSRSARPTIHEQSPMKETRNEDKLLGACCELLDSGYSDGLSCEALCVRNAATSSPTQDMTAIECSVL